MTQAPIPAFGGGGSLPPITVAPKPNFANLARVSSALAENITGVTTAKPRSDSLASLYDDDLGEGAEPSVQETIADAAEETYELPPLLRNQRPPGVVETTLGELMEQMGIQAHVSSATPAPVHEAVSHTPKVDRAVTLGSGGERSSMSHIASLARSVVGNMSRRT